MHSLSRGFGLVLSIGICVGIILVPSSSYASGENGWLNANGLAARPVDSRTWFLYTSEPGSRIADTIEFWNMRPEAVTVVVGVSDAELLDGAFSLQEPDQMGRYIGRWVNFPVREINMIMVGAGQKRLFPFAVTVPLNISPGDYWGGVTIREIGTRGSSWRVGVRMLVRVASESFRPARSQYLPQIGAGAVYYPELTLFLRHFVEHLSPVFQVLAVPFYRG